MEIAKSPSRAARRPRFRSRRIAREQPQPTALAHAAPEGSGVERHSPFSSVAEALSAIYVAAARTVLQGVEAFQDHRAGAAPQRCGMA